MQTYCLLPILLGPCLLISGARISMTHHIQRMTNNTMQTILCLAGRSGCPHIDTFFSIQHLSRHIFLYSFFYTLLSIHIFSIQHVFFYTTFSIHIFSIHNFLYNTFFSIQFCLYTFCLYTLSIQHNFFYTIRPGPFLLVEARAGGEGGVSQEFTIN